MTNLGPYEVHPFADAFPLLEGEEFDDLVMDVKRNGLREPIVLTHDKAVLVDGRNRFRACEAAGVDPVFVTLGSHYSEAMILDLIVSKNIARRQLNAGQKAAMALEYERHYADATKPGRPIGDSTQSEVTKDTKTEVDLSQGRAPQARDKAAQTVGVSGASVQRAKAVQRDAPDLYDQVRSGDTALDAAYKQSRERKKAEPTPDPAPKPSPTMLTLRTHKGDEVQYPKPQAKATFNETTGDGISWAAWSWNPVTGCLHGCKYCYARAIINRYPDANPAGFTPLFHEQRLDAPSNTVIPERHRDDDHPVSCQAEDCKVCAYRRVFVCSMADLYGRWVPDEWINQVHASMLAAPEWEYLLLTKFPDRYVGLEMPPGAWVGTSVDEQKRVRIAERAFRQIEGAKVKWLSLEPLTEPLEFEDLSMFDWVVIGAQTATHQPEGTVEAFAPPFDWVARLYIQAKEAGCKVHLKPNLNGRPGMQLPNEYPEV